MEKEKEKPLRERALEDGNARNEWRSFGSENEKWNQREGVCGATMAALLFNLCLLTHPTRMKDPKCVLYTCSTYATKSMCNFVSVFFFITMIKFFFLFYFSRKECNEQCNQ